MEQKVLIDSIDTALFTCPECHREKIMQLSGYSIQPRPGRVKCRCQCGHIYLATLEKKQEPIHNTLLLGTFKSNGQVRDSGKMIIKKLNGKGLMFKTNIEHTPLTGLNLSLEFVLDDAKQSIVRKDVIVKAQKGKYLSAEFTSQVHHDNLGPYLFFNKL